MTSNEFKKFREDVRVAWEALLENEHEHPEIKNDPMHQFLKGMFACFIVERHFRTLAIWSMVIGLCWKSWMLVSLAFLIMAFLLFVLGEARGFWFRRRYVKD